MTSPPTQPGSPEEPWQLFGELLRRLRKRAGVSLGLADGALPDAFEGRLVDMEDGVLKPDVAVLIALEKAYGLSRNSLRALFEELDSRPHGDARRALELRLSSADELERPTAELTEKADGGLVARVVALLSKQHLLLAVVPAGFSFALGVAIPIALGAPGRDVGISHLSTVSLGTGSGVALIGVAYIAGCVIFDDYFWSIAVRVRRLFPALRTASALAQQTMVLADLVEGEEQRPLFSAIPTLAKSRGQRTSYIRCTSWWAASERLLIHLSIAWIAAVTLFAVSGSLWIFSTIAFPILLVLAYDMARRNALGTVQLIKEIVRPS